MTNLRKVKFFVVPKGRHAGKIRVSFIDDNTQVFAALLEDFPDSLKPYITDWLNHAVYPSLP